MTAAQALCLTVAVIWAAVTICSCATCRPEPKNTETDDCECGRYNTEVVDELQVRIAGGIEIEPHKYPWVAYIRSRYNKTEYFMCGGAVINNYYVLTAAHCVHGAEKMDVTLGLHDRLTDDGGWALIYNVSKAVPHPMFYEDPVAHKTRYDIAVVKLEPEIEFNDHVRPVCLPFKEADFTGREAIVAGWGGTESDSSQRFLFAADVKVRDIAECYKPSDQLLCASGNHGTTCLGDSGGPLFTRIGDTVMAVIGVVSTGVDCEATKSPIGPPYPFTIYSKVSYFLDWIYSVTADSAYCKTPST